MTMQIYTNGAIEIDGAQTGMMVSQLETGTRVRRHGAPGENCTVVTLPQQRYALSHDHPASGVAGRAQFEADIRALLA